MNPKNFILFVIISVAIILFISPQISFSALYPIEAKECVQRGYRVETDLKADFTPDKTYCLFPDGSRCILEEFNEGKCGIEFKTENYCIKEGNIVWDKDKCCPGLRAYKRPNFIGQSSCMKISVFERIYNQLKYNIYLWGVWGLIIVFIVGYLIYRIIKRICRQRKT